MNIFKMLETFLILSVFAYLPYNAYAESNYFSNPYLYSSEELTQELGKKTIDMCWTFGQDSHFRFVSGNNEVYFEICLGTLPNMYNDFVFRIQNKFIQNEETKQLIFSYKIKNEREEINAHKVLKRNRPNESSYIVTDRRVIEKAIPQQMSTEELTEVIRSKNILFYTGAGLSALKVPTMNELNKLLGLEETGERVFFFLENVLNNPREWASKILSFHKACIFSTPTKAHLALKELAVLKNIRIITENLDCLHEASGIYPYRIDAKHIREMGTEFLSQFDYIICIGLKTDDRGFLSWYKQHNLQGKIIAVDLEQPLYLGNEDFLLIGDLQEVIPSIQNEMKK